LKLSQRTNKNRRQQTKTGMAFDTTSGGSGRGRVYVGSHEVQGLRPTMEDEHLHFEWQGWNVAAIMDGHGGCEAAVFVAKHLQDVLCGRLSHVLSVEAGMNQEQMNQALKQAMEQTVVDLHEAYRDEEYLTDDVAAGCTLVMLIINLARNQTWCVHCGDARAVRLQKFDRFVWQWSSSDHSLERPSQLARIQSKPNFIIHKGYLLTVRNDGRDSGGINLARSIGDFRFEPAVTCFPEVSLQDASVGSVWILSCDGLVEPVRRPDGSLGEAVLVPDLINEIQKEEDLSVSCQRLVDLALMRNSCDNITCMVCAIRMK